MRALSVIPGTPRSASLGEFPEPDLGDGSILCDTVAVGLDGTDAEIVAGEYGAPPPGRDLLILGHESLGRVVDAPAESGLVAGDLVAGIVRRPDPVPCENCAVGEWDMCRNGLYTERGISGRDGFCSDRFRIEPDFAVKVDPALGTLAVLVEPTTVVAKAWEHVEAIGRRARFTPRRVLVTGAGPIGLLAALLGTQRGLEVTVVDRVVDGPKPLLVKDLGATYHVGELDEISEPFDVAIECTGVPELVLHIVRHLAPGGVACLTGIGAAMREQYVDSAALNRHMVLGNVAVFGSVNANRRHFEAAAGALSRADRPWLDRLITRRLPLTRWPEALQRDPNDVKTIVEPALAG